MEFTEMLQTTTGKLLDQITVCIYSIFTRVLACHPSAYVNMYHSRSCCVHALPIYNIDYYCTMKCELFLAQKTYL